MQKCVAPIFDNGQFLTIPYYNDNEIIISREGRFFYNVDKYDNIIKNVSDFKRLNISKLDNIVEEFDRLLHNYQEITHLSDK